MQRCSTTHKERCRVSQSDGNDKWQVKNYSSIAFLCDEISAAAAPPSISTPRYFPQQLQSTISQRKAAPIIFRIRTEFLLIYATSLYIFSTIYIY